MWSAERKIPHGERNVAFTKVVRSLLHEVRAENEQAGLGDACDNGLLERALETAAEIVADGDTPDFVAEVEAIVKNILRKQKKADDQAAKTKEAVADIVGNLNKQYALLGRERRHP